MIFLGLPLKTMLSSRLVLGTAQLGFPYGIANKTGRPNQAVATAIIREAWNQGIREFDTAQAYGNSEQVLGKALGELGISSEARIITKFHPNLDHLDASVLSNTLNQSLERLGLSSLFGIMLHREEMLSLWDKGLGKILHDFVLSGRVEKIGISVYSPDKALQALNTEGIDMVQLPTNILDRRFERAGVFELADDAGKIIYIRSIFLQGLLLMPPDALPEHMRFAAPVLDRSVLLAQDVGLSIMELCIGYIKNAFPHAMLIFGVETLAQVRENLKLWNVAWPNGLTQKIQAEFKDIDEMILNPSLWPNGNDNTCQ